MEAGAMATIPAVRIGPEVLGLHRQALSVREVDGPPDPADRGCRRLNVLRAGHDDAPGLETAWSFGDSTMADSSIVI
jgi:hypothetical protein